MMLGKSHYVFSTTAMYGLIVLSMAESMPDIYGENACHDMSSYS